VSVCSIKALKKQRVNGIQLARINLLVFTAMTKMTIIKNILIKASATTLLVYGYIFFLMLAWLLLSLPVSQKTDIDWIDTLFMAASTVSTTGLITVQPGSDYSLFGQIVILLIIQIGGVGYMTFGSLILISLKAKMSKDSLKSSLQVSKKEFAFPKEFKPSQFLKKIVLFTFSVELLGAIGLSIFFIQSGEPAPIWSAIFHSVNAFCTAGFSLMTTNFQSYQGDLGVNIIISILSLLGAIGFIVMIDIWGYLKDSKKSLHFTSKVILKVTFALLIFGTLFIGFTDTVLLQLPANERWMIAFFQVMSASTTVGFNTYSVNEIHIASIFVLYLMMFIGASPTGTGGGLKTTSLAALIGIVRSTLKLRKRISLNDKRLPLDKLQLAATSFIFASLVFFIAVLVLLLSEEAPLDWIVFEVLSALGTVGLSMGLTSELSDFGKLFIVLLMFIGRIGVLTFGIFLSLNDSDSDDGEKEELIL